MLMITIHLHGGKSIQLKDFKRIHTRKIFQTSKFLKKKKITISRWAAKLITTKLFQIILLQLWNNEKTIQNHETPSPHLVLDTSPILFLHGYITLSIKELQPNLRSSC